MPPVCSSCTRTVILATPVTVRTCVRRVRTQLSNQRVQLGSIQGSFAHLQTNAHPHHVLRPTFTLTLTPILTKMSEQPY